MAGYGDELIATGLARGAWQRGRRIAFGDRRRLIWGRHSAEIFRDNPNIAFPGTEREDDVEWIEYYKGHRIYNVGCGRHWIWNDKFNPKPGEIFFDNAELAFAKNNSYKDSIVIEPNVPNKPYAANKDWGFEKYQTIATWFKQEGYRVCQFDVGKNKLRGVEIISTPSFRHSLAVLSGVALVICPEGGLHHAAASMGRKAVVLFGGFIPPGATGYGFHVNITGGAKACGWFTRCTHCEQTMKSITPEQVYLAGLEQLNVR